MLRGPAWSGSIQQDLIEKLWVAILAYDTADPKASSLSHTEEVLKKTTECEESDDSEESTSLSDSDCDLDLDDHEGGLALANRNDLFSVLKTIKSQEGSEKPQEPHILKLDEDAYSSSKQAYESESNSKNVEIASGEENKNNLCDTPALQSPCESGAKPKENKKPPNATALQNRRPRPNTLNLSSTLKKSKIPQLSPVTLADSSRMSRRQITLKNRYQSIQNVNRPLRKGPDTKSKGIASKIPISPKKTVTPFDLRDRSELLDVIPRRKLGPNTRHLYENKFNKSNLVAWKRKAAIPGGDKTRSIKTDARQPKQRQYCRGNSSRWSNQKNDDATSRSHNSTHDTQKSGKNPKEYKTACELKNLQTSEPKRSGFGLQVSPSKSRITGNTTKNSELKLKTNDLQLSHSSDKRTVLETRSSEIRGCKKENITIQDTKFTKHPDDIKEKTNKITNDSNKQSANQTKNILVEETQDESKETSEVTDKSSPIDFQQEDISQSSDYEADVEVSRLEDCLKEAILGVLEALPEGWILVPEHTAELFSSLTSVVDSFPRPEHAHARVLSAIVDAHARRPCGKGEIAALNNAHLLLYVGLKLCCVRGRPKEGIYNLVEFAIEDQTKPSTAQEEGEIRGKRFEGYPVHIKQGNNTCTSECNRKSSREALRQRKKEKFHNPQDECHEQILPQAMCKNPMLVLKVKRNNDKNEIALKILTEIKRCEGSFDRLMMCLLLGSRAPGRGSGWYCETEDESEKVRDLRFVLDHLKYIEDCRVSEVVSAPLWSCGSSPVVLAALAESPRLVLALLQYGAGGSAANHYLYSKCYTNGVYLAIAYLVRKLESQFKESPFQSQDQHPDENPPPDPLVEAVEDANLAPAGEHKKEILHNKRDLLTLAGHTQTALCLRYLLRAVPRVPIKFLRDQLGGSNRECERDVAYLLPHTCCLQPPSLAHLSRAASRQYLRIYDLLPQVIDDLDVPQTLKDYLNLTRD